MRRLLGVLTVVLLLVACGNEDEPALDTREGTATSEDSTTTTAIEGDTSPTSEPGSGAEQIAHLTDVRAGSHEGFDRIVFEFEGDAVPGYAVEYRDPPFHEPGSGNEVAVTGEAFLYLRFEPARTAELEGEEVRVTYGGPRRFTPEGSALTEVVMLGDFEALLEWTVGLEGERPFKVSTLTGPPRVVIDVAGGDVGGGDVGSG